MAVGGSNCSVFFRLIVSSAEWSPTVRPRIRIPELSKFLPVESIILGFGIRNVTQGFRNPTNSDWNPESKFPLQRLESST